MFGRKKIVHFTGWTLGSIDNNMWKKTRSFISKVDENRQKWTPTKHKWVRGGNNNY
jgi:hypothetical protein